MKKMTIFVSLMAVFTLAICFIVLGSISIELMAALGIDAGQFGTLVMSYFITSCVVQLFIGPIVDKMGYKPVAILGFIVTSLSMFLLAFVFRLFSCIDCMYSAGRWRYVVKHCRQYAYSDCAF